MMNQIDVFILARTKLQSHKVRTAVTVGIAGLLFGLIIALLTIAQGIFTSVDKYGDVGLNNRTIIGLTYAPQVNSFNEYDHMNDPEFINEVETAYKADIANKQAIARKYSVEYDPSVSDPSPIGINSLTKQKVITNDGIASPITQKIAAEKREAADDKFSISEYLNPYKGTTLRGTYGALRPSSGALTYMKDGNENQQVSSNTIQDSMIGNGSGRSLAVLDSSIGKPFITNIKFDPLKGEIPVILPYSDAEKLLGLSQLSKNASLTERRERLSYVRAHIDEATASFCYRNDASRTLLGQAIAQQDELKRAGGNQEYIKPSIVYNTPDTLNCSATTIKSDTRSGEQKKQDTNRMLFENEVGISKGDPIQHKLTVRGVGVSGDSGSGSSTLSIAAFVNGLLNSSLGYNTWSIPEGLLSQMPSDSLPKEVFTTSVDAANSSQSWLPSSSYLIEFSDKKEARALLERTGAFSGAFGDVSVHEFGSSTLFIDEARTWVNQALLWTLIVVGSIATIILWGIIGRTISDSRRESAVFRAIGATKLDIANIYGLYTILLSLRIIVFALALGLIIALATDLLLTDTATLGAQLAYASVDSQVQFHLFDPLSIYVAIVIAVILFAGIISATIPISIGARRNPITDMRDEG